MVTERRRGAHIPNCKVPRGNDRPSGRTPRARNGAALPDGVCVRAVGTSHGDYVRGRSRSVHISLGSYVLSCGRIEYIYDFIGRGLTT